LDIEKRNWKYAMKLGDKGTGWLSAKKTIEFFKGYCDWSEEIRINPLSEAELRDYFEKVDNFNYPVRSKSIFKYKVLLESRKLESDPLVEQYYQFLNQLRENGFWLEKSFDKPYLRQSSFLAAQAFLPLKREEYGHLIAKLHKPAEIGRAKNIISGIFKNILSLSQSPDSAFHEILFDLSGQGAGETSSLFESLSRIHYEITDNLDHWMVYPENRRYKSNIRELFGDTLVVSA